MDFIFGRRKAMDGFRRVKLELPDRVAATVQLTVLVEVLAVGGKALDEKGQLDYALVDVPLVKVHYNLV